MSSLRHDYNPEGSSLRRAQLRMLEMLDYIDAVCQEQGIRYRLDSGNVIGAVRHGGFIPWDDDIDIGLSWQDYKRLCRYLKHNPHPEFVLQTPENDKNYLYPWNKLRDTTTYYIMDYAEGSKEKQIFEQQKFHGLQIDLFPFESKVIPLLQRLAGKMACVAAFDLAKKHHFLARIVFFFNQNIAFPLFRIIGRLFGSRSLVMHSYGSWFYKKYSLKNILPYSRMSFEDRVYPVPANCDEFLREVYGDNTPLPPRESRSWHAKDIIFND